MQLIHFLRWPVIHHMDSEKTKKRKPGKVRYVWLLLVLLIILPAFSPAALASSMSFYPPQNQFLNTGLPATVDPVSANGGAYYFNLSLLGLGGPMDLAFRLSYHSGRSMAQYIWDLPGNGEWWWEPKYTCNWIEIDDETYYQFQLGGGDAVAFKMEQDGTYRLVDSSDFGISYSSSPTVYQLKDSGDYFYLLDPRDDKVYIFEEYNFWIRIKYVVDGQGNYLQYAYADGGNDTKPSRIEDNHGRSLDLEYVGNGISTVTDQAGRSITFTYESHCEDNNGDPCLRSVEDVLGQTHAFEYTSVTDDDDNTTTGLITAYTLPEGNIPYTQTYTAKTVYASDKRDHVCVASQADVYDNQTIFNWDETNGSLTLDWSDASSNTFTHADRYSPPTSVVDSQGNEIKFAVNGQNQITDLTDRMGDTTIISYHAETGKIASITNNKGDIISYTYTAQVRTFTNPGTNATVTFSCYNLTKVNYPDSTNKQFTYDESGNMLTHVDRVGNTQTYTYNDNGQVLTITNPKGGVTTYTYNEDATLASATDVDTGTTTYEYDTYKRPIKIIHPDTTFESMTYDLNNNLTSVTDELNRTITYTYDQNGNLTAITDPDNNADQTTYDLMDRPDEGTDRRGKKTRYTYNNMNQLESVTTPTGNTTQYAYNAVGWMNKVTDGAGNEWQTTYDVEGLSASEITPLNRTTTITRDKLGHITGITNPLNQTTAFTRNEMTQITDITDPLNRTTAYGYDENGQLTSVTLPTGSATQYTRNSLGLVTNIHDLGENDWTMDYTDMGRITALTDPLANQWQYAYDTLGRLEQITYPDDATQILTLDDAGNVTAKTYSDGTTLNVTYDDLDRITQTNNISFIHNEAGQITATTNPGTTFGATYNDDGGVKTVTYADGLFSVTYEYDSRDLLIKVSDDLTGTSVKFDYDADSRLTGLTRSSSVNTTFTLDDASRITRIQHAALGDLQYTYNAAGEVTRLDYALPLDPAEYLTVETTTLAYDDASQICTSGYAYDARGRQTASPDTTTFTWDGPSRLIATSEADMIYNGLNDLVTRTQDSTTTHFYYNYALGLKPMVAEKNDTTDEWSRFYVLTPAGRLLYMIDAADGNTVYFYHFDHIGNTLFLTNAAGEVTDSYAYTPYGKLLAHEGDNGQPFTFVGAWQIRQENEDGLYQMRARYYDAVSARFISREPLWPQIDNPLKLNQYQYALQNPLMYIDRTGNAIISSTLAYYLLVYGSPAALLIIQKTILWIAQNYEFLETTKEVLEEIARVAKDIVKKKVRDNFESAKQKSYQEGLKQVAIQKAAYKAEKSREKELKIKNLSEKIALRLAKQWRQFLGKRGAAKKAKGLWMQHGNKKLFFPGGKVWYRSLPGQGQRATIMVNLAGENAFVHLDDVSNISEGMGADWPDEFK